MRNTGKQPQRNVKADAAHCILGCFVKSFYFVWSEVGWSCQEWFGEGAAVAVSAWWAVSVAKVAVRRRHVTSSSECRPIILVTVYGISVKSIFPCLRQFDRCPSWLVHQWEQKRFWVVSIPAIVTVGWERKEKEVSANSNIALVLTAKPPIECTFF